MRNLVSEPSGGGTHHELVGSIGRQSLSEEILTHAQWNLPLRAIGFGLVFMLAHTLCRILPRPAGGDTGSGSPEAAARVPAKVKRHSFAARAFHWIMAASDADAAR